MNVPLSVFMSSRNFPRCKIRISSTFEGIDVMLGFESRKKSPSSVNVEKENRNQTPNNRIALSVTERKNNSTSRKGVCQRAQSRS